jgi:PBP1b-binding outer membrane lipoprotein LpoB
MRDKFDLDSSIYKPNNGTVQPLVSSTDEDRFYTVLGEQEFIDSDGYSRATLDSNNIYAKAINAEGGTQYFVKCNRYGKLFNPSGMFTEGNHKRFNKMIGANEFNFKRVNLRIFELYTSFLKTRNIAWLNNAEREMV